jgi:glycosyltransferase involved in cell wall biosynthesis
MNKGISVIICCHDSEARIDTTLDYLFKQKLSENINWEIIVVDNASKDNTLKLAEDKLKNFQAQNFSFQIQKEEKLGLNYARLKGIQSACYQYLLFCDDDNRLTENYISTGFNVLNNNPDIGALGGLALPFFEVAKPEWFDKYQLYFAVGKQCNIMGNITNSKGWVYGAGFFINKEAIMKINQHEFKTIGRKGKELSSGEDVELCFYIIIQGYKIWYSEELKFFHYMPEQRLNIDYLKRLMIAGAKNAYHLDGLSFKARSIPGNVWYKRKWILRFLLDVLRIKDWKSDGYIATPFKLKLHLLRMASLLKLNFKYDRSFK